MVKQKRKFGGRTYGFMGFEKDKRRARRQAKRLGRRGVRVIPLTSRQKRGLKRLGTEARYVLYVKS